MVGLVAGIWESSWMQNTCGITHARCVVAFNWVNTRTEQERHPLPLLGEWQNERAIQTGRNNAYRIGHRSVRHSVGIGEAEQMKFFFWVGVGMWVVPWVEKFISAQMNRRNGA